MNGGIKDQERGVCSLSGRLSTGARDQRIKHRHVHQSSEETLYCPLDTLLDLDQKNKGQNDGNNDPEAEDSFSSTSSIDEMTALLPYRSQSSSDILLPNIGDSDSWFKKRLPLSGLNCIPAVILGLVLNILDAMSYGILIFPHGDALFATTGRQAGISIYLVSSIVAQLVYACGGSAFKGAVGSMMIEIIPFLHIICRVVEEMAHSTTPPSGSSHIVSTILLAYSSTTILTGLIFLLLGYFKVGQLVQFFPRHVLIGCIGGIGLFLIQTGLEVSTGMELEMTWSSFLALLTPSALKIWGLSFGLAILLKSLRLVVTHPLLLPAFFIFIVLVFHFILFACGSNVNQARQEGWLFDEPSSETPSIAPAAFWTFWTWLDLTKIQWKAFIGMFIPFIASHTRIRFFVSHWEMRYDTATFPTQLAASLFAILHVPINVPALSLSSRQEVAIDREITGHGVSNIISGLFLATPNYLVYSNSLLFIRSGGDKSRASGFLLALGTVYILVAGGGVIQWIPTFVVGSLIFLLGLDLLQESVYDTWRNRCIHALEYVTIMIIIGVMGAVGFTQGIIAGLIFTCLFFVIRMARRSIVASVMDGTIVRSCTRRCHEHQVYLDQAGACIQVIQLCGFIFFASINQVKSVLAVHPSSISTANIVPSVRYIILDFSSISGIDFSALEFFIKLKRQFAESPLSPLLLFSGLQGKARHLSDDDDDYDEGKDDDYENNSLFFHSLNDALDWCERELLDLAFKPLDDFPLTSGSSAESSLPIVYTAKRLDTLNGYDTHAWGQVESRKGVAMEENSHPLVTFILKLSHSNSTPSLALSSICDYAQLDCISAGTLLWSKRDQPDIMFILAKGRVLLRKSSEIPFDKAASIEVLDPGCLVGAVEFILCKQRICSCLVASEDVMIWKWTRPQYEVWCQTHPELVASLMRFVLESEYNRMYHMLLNPVSS